MYNNISATVMIVQDLDKCRNFYQDILGLKALFTDDVSSAYRMGEHDFVLLQESAAADMMGKEAISLGQGAGHRVLLCIAVEDVDTSYKDLSAKGIAFIKPPKSQHWGRRTAYFADPEGNLWELWHPLPDEQN